MTSGRAHEELPITGRSLIKWSSVLLTVITVTVAISARFGSLEAEDRMLAARITEVDKARMDQHAQLQARMSQNHATMHENLMRMREEMDQADRDINHLNRKMDVALAILERMERNRQ